MINRLNPFKTSLPLLSWNHIRGDLLGILSGLLIGTSYIPFPPWAIAFCYIPLWWAVAKWAPTAGIAFRWGWWTQFVLSLIGFHWVYHVSHTFGFMPKPIAFLILILFASFIHWHIPLSVMLWKMWIKKVGLKGSSFLALPLGFWLIEQFWPMIFPWHLGYTLLYAKIPVIQTAELWGFSGLNLFILVTQSIVMGLIVLWKKSIQRAVVMASLILFWLFLTLWGKAIEKEFERGLRYFKKIGIVQTNIGNIELFETGYNTGFQRRIIDRHVQMTQELVSQHPNLDLIIWPEGSIPEFLDDHNRGRKYASYFFEQIASIKKPLLVGSFSNDPTNRIPRRDFNALFFFDESTQLISPPYHKTKLLVFGEWIPMASEIPFLAQALPAGTGLSAGDGPQVFAYQDLMIGAQICYESLYPLFTTQLKKLGANLIVNVTNDSWFGPRSEPYQHLYMTFARALEVRLPLVRATRTGISGAIDARGKILNLSPLDQPWLGVVEVPFFWNYKTIYVSLAFWLPLIGVIGLLVLILIGLRNQTSTDLKTKFNDETQRGNR